jgi:tryptophan 6-halogenase
LDHNAMHSNYKSPHDMDQLADFIRRCGLNFKKHNELLV